MAKRKGIGRKTTAEIAMIDSLYRDKTRDDRIRRRIEGEETTKREGSREARRRGTKKKGPSRERSSEV